MFYATVEAKTGILIGGTLCHESSLFDSREEAKRWAETVIDINKNANRNPSPYTLWEYLGKGKSRELHNA